MILSLVEREGPCETKNLSIVIFEILRNMGVTTASELIGTLFYAVALELCLESCRPKPNYPQIFSTDFGHFVLEIRK